MRPKGTSQIVDSKVAREVTRMVNTSDKSQFQITADMGMKRSNIITMIKQGRTKLPLTMVVPLARACGEDPGKLMRLCLEEYSPAMLDALGEAFNATITEDEAAIMRSIRHARKVRENDLRVSAARGLKTRSQKSAAKHIRAEYNTSPEQLRKVYEFSLENLVQ